MYRNIAGQKLTVFAFDSTTNLPVTGDAANITAYVDIDDAGVNVLADTSASEISSANAAGYYSFDLAQAETNGVKLLFSAKSVTANIVVIGVPAVCYTDPANYSSTSITAAGLVAPSLAGAIGTSPWNATSLADALKAAWSQGVGKWAIVGTTLNVYAPDGTTVLKAFTLDSATAPTTRS